MKTQHVLPATVFDALELSAIAHKGIGSGTFYDYRGPTTPCCIYGHGFFLDNRVDFRGRVCRALRKIGLDPSSSDAVVHRLSGKRDRISFARWCRAFNIVRGES